MLSYISDDKVDFRWDNPDGTSEQLDTRKRASIKHLPPTLVIHLKRFEFDFNLLQQVKLNTVFEFPQVLDMKPYSVEGRADPAPGAEAREVAHHPDE